MRLLDFYEAASVEEIDACRAITESEWPKRERDYMAAISNASLVFDRIIQNRSVKVFLGKYQDEPVVTGSLYFLPVFRNGYSEVAQLENLVVLPAYRGKGFGRMMVEHIISWANNNKWAYKLDLACSDNNVAFYEKLGFYKHENIMRMDLW